MNILNYPWLKNIYKNIIFQHVKNNAHHSTLIYAHSGIGHQILIKYIIFWLMCENKNILNCKICRGCKLVISENHPDVILLDKKFLIIGIKEIRIIIDNIYTYPTHNKKKVIYINVDKLTDNASHALLKLIEEPPKNVYFFLKTANIKKLLTTILSRCIKLYLLPPSEVSGLIWLKKQINNNNIKEINYLTSLRLSYHAPILAMHLIKNQWELRNILLNSFNKSIDTNIFYLLPILNNINIIQYIHWIISLFLDAVKYNNGIKEIFFTNLDNIQLIKKISDKFSIYKLHAILHCLFNLSKNIKEIEIKYNNFECIIIEKLLVLEKLFDMDE